MRGRLSAGQPTDGPIVADLGFRGTNWRHHWRRDWATAVLLKSDFADGPHQAHAVEWFNGLRQAIETTFSCLEGQLRLKYPRARTYWGLLTRLAAKISAYNLAVGFNYLFDRPTYALFNPLA